MCESTVYLRRGEQEEKLMSDVARIMVEGDRIVIIGLLGEQREVRADVVALDLVGHRVLLRER
ncbi:MAG: CooT family nickel-binding protein [Deltaproteobacteria bacterium]|nr:CooT family nickel-binding protein [Deltaproteobacteria bacterium]